MWQEMIIQGAPGLLPRALWSVTEFIATRLESKSQLVRHKIVVINFGARIAALKGIARPEVAEADHVCQVVIDFIGCADIKFVADVLG